MNTTATEPFAQIQSLFDRQRLCVLSTQKDGQPYASLVGFSATNDLKEFVFLTPETTRKYDNLIASPKVSTLVNNSRNQTDDYYSAVAVTGTGVSQVIDKDEYRDELAIYLNRHPSLESFSNSPTTAFIRVTMNRYFMVDRFQHVVELKV